MASHLKADYYGGIDIGASNVRIGIWNEIEEELVSEPKKVPREKIGSEEDLLDQVSKYLNNQGITEDDLYGIGIGSPGLVDRDEKRISAAANMAELDFKSVDSETPIFLENDATTAAIGEKVHGFGKNYDKIAHLAFGTGIGGGIIIRDNILLDTELGFTQADSNIDMEAFGKRNVWEAFAAGTNIPDFYDKFCKNIDEDVYIDTEDLTTKAVFDIYQQGDPVTETFVEEELARINASGLGNVINSYDDLDLITIGGGVMLNQPYLLNQAKEFLDDYAVFEPEKIEITPLGEDIGVYGAIELTKLRLGHEAYIENIHNVPESYKYTA